MDQEAKFGKSFPNWLWPVTIFIVVVMLLSIQMLRVNKPEEAPAAGTAPIAYSTPGPLLSGELEVGGGDFLSKQVNLNRRAKISGEFQTGSVKSKVAVVVVDEMNFEKWKQQTDFKQRVGTGYVPGGKISPVLEPGTYFLIIDNRVNGNPLSLQANFNLE